MAQLKNFNYMKKTLLLFFAFILIQGSHAAKYKQQMGTYEKKAVEILSLAFNKLKAHDAIYMEFSFTSSQSEMAAFDDLSGFLYSKGDKYYIKSGDMHFISDGILAWTFLEDVNEVHISYLEDTEGALSPISIIENFEDDFMPLWLRKDYVNSRKAHIIDMVPIEPHSFSKYRVGIDTESADLLFMTAFDSQGNTYTYAISKIKGSPDISDGLFVFDPNKHPGVEVIDLR